MKKHIISIIAILTIGLLLSNCNNNESKKYTPNWYEYTKSEIMKQSDLEPDSIITEKDTTMIKEHSYFNGKEFHLRLLKNGKLRMEKIYSKDGNFEIVREFFDNGNYLFEGITYKDHFYGLSTWKYQNGQLNEKGIRFNDKKIGVWKTWNESGKLVESVDYKNLEKLDSMPKISK
jgi:hypothetical protein